MQETGFLCNTHDVPTSWSNHSFTHTESIDAEVVAGAHVACSSISALCCLIVLIVSAKIPTLRKYPANMLMWKTGCDLLASLVIVGINGSLLTMRAADPSTSSSSIDVAHGAELCEGGFLAGVTGFCLLASPGWFFCLAYNLNRSLHDPFTKPQSRMTKYHLWVWSTSLIVGLSVGALHEYRPNLHLCFTCHGLSPVMNWLLLYGWFLSYW